MEPSVNSRVIVVAVALFWTALAVALFMAFDPKPPQVGIEALGDKFQHMLAFLVLTALAQTAFTRVPRWRIAERLSFLGAMIELVQSIPALHRDCDIKDWLADTLVILVVTIVFVLCQRSHRSA
jgi:VanZ family protein